MKKTHPPVPVTKGTFVHVRVSLGTSTVHIDSKAISKSLTSSISKLLISKQIFVQDDGVTGLGALGHSLFQFLYDFYHAHAALLALGMKIPLLIRGIKATTIFFSTIYYRLRYIHLKKSLPTSLDQHISVELRSYIDDENVYMELSELQTAIYELYSLIPEISSVISDQFPNLPIRFYLSSRRHGGIKRIGLQAYDIQNQPLPEIRRKLMGFKEADDSLTIKIERSMLFNKLRVRTKKNLSISP